MAAIQKELDLPEHLTEQIEKAFMHCTVEIPNSDDAIRVTTLEIFNDTISQVMKLAYVDGILEGLKKGKEIVTAAQTNY